MSDDPVIETVSWQAGPWLKADVVQEGAPHRRPWQRLGETADVDMIWEDEARTVPLAAVDHDGCRAVIIRRLP